jgi:hypothetical protein
VPVVSTAALADGARCAHQSVEGEGPGMGPMLGGAARDMSGARARAPQKRASALTRACPSAAFGVPYRLLSDLRPQAGRTTLWIADSPS